jgi:hypothetical protein
MKKLFCILALVLINAGMYSCQADNNDAALYETTKSTDGDDVKLEKRATDGDDVKLEKRN